MNGAGGIAVLPQHNKVFVSSYKDDKLHAHRLSDGVLVASAIVPWCSFLASDPATSTVYACVYNERFGVFDENFIVVAFRWNGVKLVKDGKVEAAGATNNHRPLAVMPPAPGLRTSYLVMGTLDSPTLIVLSLPDRRLVHTHTLEGMQVVGLAADPSGTALAVCDYSSKAVHALPWPLPGMPAMT